MLPSSSGVMKPMTTNISPMSEILIHLLLIVAQDGDVELMELWDENPDQRLEDVFADILNSVKNNLARR